MSMCPKCGYDDYEVLYKGDIILLVDDCHFNNRELSDFKRECCKCGYLRAVLVRPNCLTKKDKNVKKS